MVLLCVHTVWWRWKLDYKFAGQRGEEKSVPPKVGGQRTPRRSPRRQEVQGTCKVGARR